MWVLLSLAVTAAALISGLGLLARRRRRSSVPFDELTHEDQVAAMENLRGDASRRGGHESAKGQGNTFTRNSWGGTP